MASRGQSVMTNDPTPSTSLSNVPGRHPDSDSSHHHPATVMPAVAASGTAQTRGARSLSRSSFVGRSRLPVSSASDARQHSITGRWRSQSRTVRGSVDESDAYKADRKAFWDRSRSRSRAPPSKPKETSPSKQPPGLGKPEGSGPRVPPQSLSDYEKRFLAWLPRFISRFLGFRDKSNEGVALIPGVQHLPAYMETWIFAWIGAFLSLATIALIFTHAEPFIATEPIPKPWAGPVIIGSFGASSVLLFGAPASPLGQPWNFVFGQAISAAAGVAVAKLFELNPRFNYESLDASDNLVWVAGGCATAMALLLMLLTNSVHPPGGATALLAATTPNVTKLGWRYIATALLSGAVMLGWAMLIMNLGRKRYPTHWINGRSPGTGLDLIDDIAKLFKPKDKASAVPSGEGKKDEERASSGSGVADVEKNATSRGEEGGGKALEGEAAPQTQQTSSEETLRERVARIGAHREEAEGNVEAQEGWRDETAWREEPSSEEMAERTSRWARS